MDTKHGQLIARASRPTPATGVGRRRRLLALACALAIVLPTLSFAAAAVARKPAPSFNELLAAGSKLNKQKKWAEARDRFQQASKLAPQHAQPYLLIAQTFAKEDNADEALNFYKRAYSLNHDTAYLRPLNSLARDCERGKQWPRAIAILTFLNKENNNHPNHVLNLLRVLRGAGQDSQAAKTAMACYREFDWSSMSDVEVRQSSRERLAREITEANKRTGKLPSLAEELHAQWEKDKDNFADGQLLKYLCTAAGEEARRKSDTDKAAKFFTYAIDLLPDSAGPYASLSYQLRDQGRAEAALAILQRGRERFPDDVGLLSAERDIRNGLAQYKDVVGLSGKIITQSNNLIAERRKKLSELAELAEPDSQQRRTIASAKKDLARLEREMLQHKWHLFSAQLELKDYHAAQASMEFLLERLEEINRPSRTERDQLLRLRAARFEIYSVTGRIKELLDEAIAACGEDPKSPELLEQLGNTYLTAGEPQVAVGYFLLAARHHKDGPKYLLDKADSLARQTQKDHAKLCYETFIRAFPDDPQIIKAIEKFESAWRLRRGRWQSRSAGYVRACQLIEQTAAGLEQRSPDKNVRQQAAWWRIWGHFAYQSAGREIAEEKIKEYRDLLERWPDHPRRLQALQAIARVYEESLGDFTQARDAWLKCYQDTDDAHSLRKYAEVSLMLGDVGLAPSPTVGAVSSASANTVTTPAETLLAQHIAKHPHDYGAQLLHAELLERMGQRDRAHDMIRQLYQLEPKENQREHTTVRTQIKSRYPQLLTSKPKTNTISLPETWVVEEQNIRKVYGADLESSASARNAEHSVGRQDHVLAYTRYGLRLPRAALERLPLELELTADKSLCDPGPFAPLVRQTGQEQRFARFNRQGRLLVTTDTLRQSSMIYCRTQYSNSSPPSDDLVVRRRSWIDESSRILTAQIYVQADEPITLNISSNHWRRNSIKSVFPETGYSLDSNHITYKSARGTDFENGTTITLKIQLPTSSGRGRPAPQTGSYLPKLRVDFPWSNRELALTQADAGRSTFELGPLRLSAPTLAGEQARKLRINYHTVYEFQEGQRKR
ncbi:tetratricopeptide repeat protein [Candidatus Sumerlaeota bacterium]